MPAVRLVEQRLPTIDNFVITITSAEVVLRHGAVQNLNPLTGTRVMSWTSDSKWIALYSTLATLFICSWAYIPA